MITWQRAALSVRRRRRHCRRTNNDEFLKQYLPVHERRPAFASDVFLGLRTVCNIYLFDIEVIRTTRKNDVSLSFGGVFGSHISPNRFGDVKFDGTINLGGDDPIAISTVSRFATSMLLFFLQIRSADDIWPLSERSARRSVIPGGVIVVTNPIHCRPRVRPVFVVFSTVRSGPRPTIVWASSCSRYISTKSSRVVFIEPERHVLDRVIDYTTRLFRRRRLPAVNRVRCTRLLTLWPYVLIPTFVVGR